MFKYISDDSEDQGIPPTGGGRVGGGRATASTRKGFLLIENFRKD